MYFNRVPLIFRLSGSSAAHSIRRVSRKGQRTSRACAIDVRSVFTSGSSSRYVLKFKYRICCNRVPDAPARKHSEKERDTSVATGSNSRASSSRRPKNEFHSRYLSRSGSVAFCRTRLIVRRKLLPWARAGGGGA